MKANHRPATQLLFAGSTSSEDTDDDGDIMTGHLKRPSCKANIAIRLKRVSPFRGRSNGRHFRKLLDAVVSQTLSNASIVSKEEYTRRQEQSRTNPRTGTLNRTTNYHPGCRQLPAARHRRPTLHHLRMQTISRSMTGTSKRAALTEHQLSLKANITIRLKRS